MDKMIFRNDWHELSPGSIFKLLSDNFIVLTAPPSQGVIAALQKQGIATLQVMENRSLSTSYRVWQTDEVFLCSSLVEYAKEFSSTEEYFSVNHRDALLAQYTRKKPVFVGKRTGLSSCFIKHIKEPQFYCHYDRGRLLSTSFSGATEPESKLLIKCDAFYKSYFKPLKEPSKVR